ACARAPPPAAPTSARVSSGRPPCCAGPCSRPTSSCLRASATGSAGWLGADGDGLGKRSGRKGLAIENGPGCRAVLPQAVCGGVRARHALLLQAEAHAQLSVREGAPLTTLSRRARVAPLSQRRGALYRLQTLRGDLSGASDHHRGGAAPQ